MDLAQAADPFDVRVESARLLTPRVKSMGLRILGGRALSFRAGQYMQVFVPRGSEPAHYSIASAPHRRDFFELCVTRMKGRASSEFVHSLREGDELKVAGPFGHFTLPEEELSRDAVFITTGSGIAPLRSMILDLFDRRTARRLFLLFGVRAEEDILYREEWDASARAHSNFECRFILSRPETAWAGRRGYVQDHIQDFVPDPRNADFYLCGLRKMIFGVKDALTRLHVSKDRIHHEKYD